jgi:replicative DNA helicase
MKSKSADVFSHGPVFQTQMLALMLKDLAFTSNVFSVLTEDLLYSESHKWLFKTIKEKFTSTGKPLTLIEVEDQIKFMEKSKRRLFLEFAKNTFTTKIEDEDYIKAQVTDHAQRVAFIDIFKTAQTIWNEGKQKDAIDFTRERMEEVKAINFTNEASIPIQEFLKRRRLMKSGERHLYIPTAITPLDETLRGGLNQGELGILLAEPKKGKSIGLLHMGVAGVYNFARVAHFVLEGTTDQALDRYLTRLSGVPYDRIVRDQLTNEEATRIEKTLARYKDNLDLIPFNQHWNYTVLDVEAKLKELKSIGREPDLIIIDYADLLKANSTLKEKRHEQTEVYRDLKRLAVMAKKPIWTASQAVRPSDQPENEYLLRAKDISESYEKVRIADLVITLNQTPREKENGILRFHLDIYRSNDFDTTLRLITNFEKMIFYSKSLGHYTSFDHADWMDRKKRK